MSSNKSVKERLVCIETEMINVKKILDDIKNNDLHAIYEKFDDIWKKFGYFEKKLTSRLPLWATIFISFLCSLVTGLIIYGVMRK